MGGGEFWLFTFFLMEGKLELGWTVCKGNNDDDEC